MKRWLVWTVVWVACAPGCLCAQAAPRLAVDLKTDLRAGLDFVEVRTFVFAGGPDDERSGRGRQSVQTASRGMDFVAGRRVADVAGVETGAHGIHVRLVDATGAVVAHRLVLVEIGDGTTVVKVVIAKECAAASDPLECGRDCREDAECPAGPDCTTPLCADGTCLAQPHDDRCGLREYCSALAGCLPVPGGVVDAGPLPADAGPRCDPCDDGNDCTDDTCDGAGGCRNTPNAAACDDGVFCNGPDNCGGGTCSVHAGDPCPGAPVCDEGTRTCVGCTTTADCPGRTEGEWGACRDFGGTCDDSGTETREVTTWACMAGSCVASSTTESRGCSRGSRDGISCGADDIGGWSGCDYAGACAESGERARTITTFRCAGGTCEGIGRTETEPCARSTEGDVCGADGSYCGVRNACHVCRGGSCVLNEPHFDAACNPSCGGAGSACGVTPMCCPATSTGCPTVGPGPWADCAVCCQGAFCY